MSHEFTNVLIRMSLDLKERLQREAFANGRKLTSEVNMRLEESLKEAPAPKLVYSATPRPDAAHHANDNGPAHPLSGIDQAMLDVFRRLPAEKQLALLSLFR